MIREIPTGQEVDPLTFQMGHDRGRDGRPWVMANFVSTIDGAAVVDGGSTAINDADDQAMFTAIRAAADFILVGAETVRSDNYGPVRLDQRHIDARREAGLDDLPRLVVVTRSLRLDQDARAFEDPARRATILTGPQAPDQRLSDLSEVADVISLDDTTPSHILDHLGSARVVLCEGGPSLWGQFVAARLVDEMALTISPLLVSGDATRVTHGPVADPPLEMSLDRVLYGDRALFLRYMRA